MTIGGRRFNPEVSVSEQRRFAPNPRPQPTPYNELSSSGRVIYGQENGPSMFALREKYTTPEVAEFDASQGILSAPSTREKYSAPSALRANRNISVQDATSMILETKNTADAMQIIRNLPSRKRALVLKRLAATDSNIARKIADQLKNEAGIREFKQSIDALDKLRNSKDPERALEAMLKNPITKKSIQEDPTSFYIAIQQNVRANSANRAARRNGYSLLSRIEQLLSANGINTSEMKFKSGGVLKAQAGFTTPKPWKNIITGPDYNHGIGSDIKVPGKYSSIETQILPD